MQRKVFATLAAILVALAAGAARAEEIHLLSAASMQTVFKEILGDFEHSSGHKVVVGYSTMAPSPGVSPAARRPISSSRRRRRSRAWSRRARSLPAASS
jgi:hypothetical protein